MDEGSFNKKKRALIRKQPTVLFGVSTETKKETGICGIERGPSEKQVFLITKQICKCSPANAPVEPLQYMATGNSTKLGHTH